MKRSALCTITSIFYLLLIGACAYEPRTINKTTRVPEPKIKPILEDLGPKKLKSNKKNITAITVVNNKSNLPNNIRINLTNFKKRLVGLNNLEVRELLGAPKFKRNEHSASIWQYQSTVCLVDIFLFTQEKILMVDHVEIRSKKIQNMDENKCFASILSVPSGKNNSNKNVN